MWVGSIPAACARSICARNSAFAASGTKYRRKLATSRQRKPSSSISPDTWLTVEIGAQR